MIDQERKAAYGAAHVWLEKKRARGYSWDDIRSRYSGNHLKQFLEWKADEDDWLLLSVKEWNEIVDHSQKFERLVKDNDETYEYYKEYKWFEDHMDLGAFQ